MYSYIVSASNHLDSMNIHPCHKLWISMSRPNSCRNNFFHSAAFPPIRTHNLLFSILHNTATSFPFTKCSKTLCQHFYVSFKCRDDALFCSRTMESAEKNIKNYVQISAYNILSHFDFNDAWWEKDFSQTPEWHLRNCENCSIVHSTLNTNDIFRILSSSSTNVM